MDGDARQAEVSAQLSKLTGRSIGPDDVVSLRSVERAAFASWASSRGVALGRAATSSAPFTVRSLLEGGPAVATPARPASAAPVAPAAGIAVSGIGIDVEETASLPEADDYREHAFYQDHFTAAEIARCLRHPDPRAAFCGQWAAKEAILKAGLVSSDIERLGDFEVGRDAQGRPVYPGGLLSLSHTPRTAVAVCLALAQPAPIAERAPVAEPAIAPEPAAVARPRRRLELAVVSIVVAAVLGAGAVSYFAHETPTASAKAVQER